MHGTFRLDLRVFYYSFLGNLGSIDEMFDLLESKANHNYDSIWDQSIRMLNNHQNISQLDSKIYELNETGIVMYDNRFVILRVILHNF